MKGENLSVKDIRNIYYFIVNYYMDHKTCCNINKNSVMRDTGKVLRTPAEFTENVKENIHSGFCPEDQPGLQKASKMERIATIVTS